MIINTWNRGLNFKQWRHFSLKFFLGVQAKKKSAWWKQECLSSFLNLLKFLEFYGHDLLALLLPLRTFSSCFNPRKTVKKEKSLFPMLRSLYYIQQFHLVLMNRLSFSGRNSQERAHKNPQKRMKCHLFTFWPFEFVLATSKAILMSFYPHKIPSLIYGSIVEVLLSYTRSISRNIKEAREKQMRELEVTMLDQISMHKLRF